MPFVPVNPSAGMSAPLYTTQGGPALAQVGPRTTPMIGPPRPTSTPSFLSGNKGQAPAKTSTVPRVGNISRAAFTPPASTGVRRSAPAPAQVEAPAPKPIADDPIYSAMAKREGGYTYQGYVDQDIKPERAYWLANQDVVGHNDGGQ